MGKFKRKGQRCHFGWKLTHRLSWGCWYLFRHEFSKFPNQNLFLGKFGPKKSKLFVLPLNRHMGYLEDADSYWEISVLNFQPKIHFWANLGDYFCLKINTHSISRILIPVLMLVFSNFEPKSWVCWFLFWDYFCEIPNLIPFYWANLSRKS